jgi:MtN3 and saliva related transmembrane protein
MGNAALFVPQALAVWRKKSDEGISLITFAGFNLLQAIAIVQGIYQHDLALIVGMVASIITCGAVTSLTVFYRMKRKRASIVAP